MISKSTQTAESPAAKEHATFFRQSGWLMIATVVGGAMSFGVHFLSKVISGGEYTIFVTILALVNCVPAIPLQMVFAQQTASALATDRKRQLSGMIRTAAFWAFILWLVAAAGTWLFQGEIVAHWKLTNPTVLWVAMVMVLLSVWSPIFGGALQGKQDFFWMGWAAILNSVARVGIAILAVLALGSGSTGMMTGALIGLAIAVGISMWKTWDLWSLPKMSFDGKALLRQAMPLVLGFGACQFLFASDTMFATPHFRYEEMKCYALAGTLSRALLWVVLPLATVMFPKIVHSSVRSEKINLLGIVLICTAVLAICGGLALCLIGPWVVRLVANPDYVQLTTGLLPWYVAAMIPFALANVLVNDLLARGKFRVVPLTVILAFGFGITLTYILNHGSHKLQVVLQTLFVFNLLLLAVCAWAAFRKSSGQTVVS
jgi:O-antigen/teichoic acid export membrane protein